MTDPAVEAVEGLREDGCERCGRVECPNRSEVRPRHALDKHPDPMDGECALCDAIRDCQLHRPDFRRLYFTAASQVRALAQRVEELERELEVLKSRELFDDGTRNREAWTKYTKPMEEP